MALTRGRPTTTSARHLRSHHRRANALNPTMLLGLHVRLGRVPSPLRGARKECPVLLGSLVLADATTRNRAEQFTAVGRSGRSCRLPSQSVVAPLERVRTSMTDGPPSARQGPNRELLPITEDRGNRRLGDQGGAIEFVVAPSSDASCRTAKKTGGARSTRRAQPSSQGQDRRSRSLEYRLTGDDDHGRPGTVRRRPTPGSRKHDAEA
jgi:hypothetical protein